MIHKRITHFICILFTLIYGKYHVIITGYKQRLYITRRVTSRFDMGRHFEFMERQGPSDWR